jgi:DNA (cytosine-5)-methyltransferase 1
MPMLAFEQKTEIRRRAYSVAETGADSGMITPQFKLDLNQELIIDNFAGGGGASTGIELALGRHVDIAINHDPKAIAMHLANHPQTLHLCESVWEVDPREVVKGRPVALLWLSPDCKHFSKAKGGKPVEKKIRGLAWIAVRYAATVKPRVIMLENVEEFETWGPLSTDGKPCKKNKGREFNAFKNALKRHGYEIEHRALRGCDFGAPTIRKRLFMIARCDGQPIVWPEPTHADPKSEAVKSKRLKPWRTAAECIDWSIACPSIFERSKPLAEATQRRIAKGIMRYVVNSDKPFIVTMAHGEGEGKTKRWGSGVRSVDEPVPTITGSGGYGLAAPLVIRNDMPQSNSQCNYSAEEPIRTLTSTGGFSLVAPFLTEHANASNQRSMPADEPVRTLCAQVKGGHFSLVNAFLTKFRTGAVGSDLSEPMHTITAGGGEGRPAGAGHAMGLVASSLVKMRGTNTGQATDEPLHTISAGGTHFADVRAFLISYYGSETETDSIKEPLRTVTSRDRFGLVTIQGQDYAIVDIGLRMLAPRELFKAQGFPDTYIIGDKPEQGLTLTKSEQVRMVGNSVCPPMAKALVMANLVDLRVMKVAA